MNGARALLEMLRAAGVDRLFGNPGTTELPLLDVLVSFEGLRYHLALQEGVAAGMADGYAQASGRVGVLSLHATGGLANAVGLLYNAGRAGTPLLVLAGQQDTRLAMQEPFLYSDMVRWMRPLVKWAREVAHPGDLARALRRALSEAVTPPAGPVFLAVPLDVLRAEGTPVEDVVPRASAAAAPPDGAGIAAVSEVLRAARAPLIVAGDRVAQAHAEGELLALAEAAGWPVALEPYPARFVFPTRHPLARGPLPRFAAGVRAALAPHDAVLAVGLTPFEHFLYDGADPVPEGTRLVHLDAAAAYVGRNHPVAAGACGDLRAGLAALRAHLDRAVDAGGKPDGGSPPGRARAESVVGAPERGDPPLAAGAGTPAGAAARPAVPDPGAVAGALPEPAGPYEAVADAVAAVLEPEDVLVEEAISGRAAVLARIPRSVPGTLFGEKGGTIGWGLPAALGVRLARPARRVVAVIGDGGLLMAAQGLWTAARDRIRVAVVVLDNGGYGILKQGLASLGGEAARRGVYPATDVRGVDVVEVARAFGVPGERVSVSAPRAAAALSDAVRRALAANGPYVVAAAFEAPVRPLA